MRNPAIATFFWFSAATALIGLSGCADIKQADRSLEQFEDKEYPPARFGGAPQSAIDACTSAASTQWGVPPSEVTAYAGTLRSDDSSRIYLHVGDNRRAAKCIVDNEGNVGDLIFESK